MGEIGGVFADDERIAGQRFDGEHVNEMKRQRLTRRAHHVSRYLDRVSWRRGDEGGGAWACEFHQHVLARSRSCGTAAVVVRPRDVRVPRTNTDLSCSRPPAWY